MIRSLRRLYRTLSAAILVSLCSLGWAADALLVLPEQASPRVRFGAEKLVDALKTQDISCEVGTQTQSGFKLQILLTKAETDLPAPWKDSAKLAILREKKTPESYLLSRQGDSILVAGVDDTGLLYGCLDLAETLGKTKGFPSSLERTEAPAFKLRGACIGMQKTYILPGRKVYEYPYTKELFPFFYDKAFWSEYLDFLAAKRMNSLYLWNGHPFASLVKLPDYPYALEVSEEQFAQNVEMFRYIAKEADKRGIWVVQMFYNIILSKPFAEKNGLSSQLDHPVPIAADYTRKSIAEFVKQYPNVGLMVCLGEALQDVPEQNTWCTDVILRGVKDGMKAAGLTQEPPVVIRTHATDPAVIMPAALKVYSNLYTEAKYNGESLTTWEPRGVWQQTHLAMSKLGSTHIANVHILANLEPFRYGAQDFIRKSMLAARDRLGAKGLHLYPLAYWSWPEAPDATKEPLKQIERDWIWFEAWARYAWNPDVDPAADKNYWVGRLTERYGNKEAAEAILKAYNSSGDCAPLILRRFGITEGNRQTMALGMTLDQLVNPKKYRPYQELWLSQAPDGERLDEFVDKEWNHLAHHGETPARVIELIEAASDSAVSQIEQAAPKVTRNREEFERLKNDMYCIQAMSRNYADKARAAIRVLRYNYSEDLTDLEEAGQYLAKSLDSYKKLVALTKDSYRFANTMQTAQRRIPVPGGKDGQPANYHWAQVLPVYEQELVELQKRIEDLRNNGGKPVGRKALKLEAAPFKLLSTQAEVFTVQTGSRVFSDKPWEIQSLAAELAGLKSFRFSHEAAAARKYQPIEFESDQPVDVLVGYVQSKDSTWLQAPMLETDAHAADNFISETLITDAISVDTLPKVNVHIYRYPAGRHKLQPRGSGSFLVLGVVAPVQTTTGMATGAVAQPLDVKKTPSKATEPQAVTSARTLANHRYLISACDWMMLKRQKLGAVSLAHEIGADGLELDMGSLGQRETFDNKLLDPAVRKQFLDEASRLGIRFSSIAMSGFYAQAIAKKPGMERIFADTIETMKLMGVKIAFLPLGVQGDLVKHPELRPVIVERLKLAGALAEKAGVVFGIETALDAAAEVKLLEEIGSPAIKIYFNFANALQNGRDLIQEIKILGKDRICQIHCTDEDGVWLQDNKRLDMQAVKKALDDMGWSGWLVIERSRSAKDGRNVRWNFGANAAYLKKVFQP